MPEAITINKAATMLQRDPRTVRGVAIGLGIALMPVATGLCMGRADFDRLRARLEEFERSETAVAAR